jgi:hypothetical protein
MLGLCAIEGHAVLNSMRCEVMELKLHVGDDNLPMQAEVQVSVVCWRRAYCRRGEGELKVGRGTPALVTNCCALVQCHCPLDWRPHGVPLRPQ